jgi:hypothetical protein
MARLARVVIPGHPHHVTQRGNGRAQTFFGDGERFIAICSPPIAARLASDLSVHDKQRL